MIVRTCQRCGEEFDIHGDEYPAYLKLLSPIDMADPEIHIEAVSSELETPHGFLCPDCRTAYTEFMDGER